MPLRLTQPAPCRLAGTVCRTVSSVVLAFSLAACSAKRVPPETRAPVVPWTPTTAYSAPMPTVPARVTPARVDTPLKPAAAAWTAPKAVAPTNAAPKVATPPRPVPARVAPTAAARTNAVSSAVSARTVLYDTFDGKTPEQKWREIDGLDYWALPLAPPSGYYAGVDASSSERLRKTLHERISRHQIFNYTHKSKPTDAKFTVDVWDIVALADEHPEKPGMILDVYENATFARQLAGSGEPHNYQREHAWPKSLGFPEDTVSNPPYSDCHHLFAAYSSYNSSRSNKPYGDGEPEVGKRKPTVENIGRGGDRGKAADTANYSFKDVWQTWLGRRGDVARAIFYMDVRYEGGHSGTGSEPDLGLTDDVTRIVNADVSGTGGQAFMGLLCVLLRWHHEDPVDDLERRRNTVVYLFQGNRNPFVDNPPWVDIVY